MERKNTLKVKRSHRQSKADSNGCMDDGEGAIFAINVQGDHQIAAFFRDVGETWVHCDEHFIVKATFFAASVSS